MQQLATLVRAKARICISSNPKLLGTVYNVFADNHIVLGGIHVRTSHLPKSVMSSVCVDGLEFLSIQWNWPHNPANTSPRLFSDACMATRSCTLFVATAYQHDQASGSYLIAIRLPPPTSATVLREHPSSPRFQPQPDSIVLPITAPSNQKYRGVMSTTDIKRRRRSQAKKDDAPLTFS